MHELYELKDKLIKELEEHGRKDLSAGGLEVVDKLAHATKNLCKIIEDMEDSGEYSGRYYGDGMPYMGGSYDDGRSYARGRGSNARRDSMGRYSRGGYSRAGEMAQRLRDLMQDAPDEHTRSEIERLASKMEQM